MMNKLFAVAFVMVAMCAMQVFADNTTVSGIAVLNCGVLAEDVTNNMSCGQVYRFSCDVSTTAIRVLNVTFEIAHGDEYFIQSAGPYYGTTKNATWALAMTADGTPYEFRKVTVMDSTLKYCGSTDDLRDIGCMVNFTSYRTIGGSCAPDVCFWTNITQCMPNDRLVKTFVPTSACGAENYTQEGICDYCTPDWRLGNNVCTVDFNSSNPYVGNMTAGYYDANDCYSKTGLGSDAQKPSGDISGVSCYLDYQVTDGKTAIASYNASVESGFSQDSFTWLGGTQEVGGNSWLARKPLAFSMLGNGLMQIFTFPQGDNNIHVAEQSGSSLSDATYAISFNGTAGQMRGQAAIYGVDGLTVNASRGVAGIVNAVNGKQYFYARDFTVTNATPVAVDLTTAGLDTQGGSVACYGTKCYFITTNNKVVGISWSSGAVTQVAASNYSTPTLEKQMQVPVFISTSGTSVPDRVAVVGTGASGPMIFNCDISLTSCNGYSVGTNISIDDVSKLAVVVKNGESFLQYTTSVVA